MSLLEIAATAFTLVSVVLSVKRSLWQFPAGIIGTGLGFFVFWGAGLLSSAVLQPIFIMVLAYGWWFWIAGDNLKAPRIRRTPWLIVALSCLGALAIAAAGAALLAANTAAAMPLADAAIFALSIVAQALLSLKRIETWPVWIVINALSVWVYGGQNLWLYTALYVFFFFNAFWGWWEWRRELRSYQPAQGAEGAGET